MEPLESPTAMEVSFTFQCGDNAWKQMVIVDGEMTAHSALKLLAECANTTLLQIGKETGVFSR